MSVIGKGKKNNSQDFYLYLHSAEKGQLPSPDETVNPLDLKKVERVACRVSVQGGVSERVKWVKFSRKLMFCRQKFKGILFFRSGRPNVQGKAVTREATREAQLKRGGMKDRLEKNLGADQEKNQLMALFLRRWGLELSCRSLGQSLEVAVKNVSIASPAQR